MKIGDAFPSKYLKSSDLPEGRVVPLTIESVSLETLGQGADKSQKIVISFIGKEKTFVCNKTNARTIEKLHGDETDEWEGKTIGLFSTEVQFGADMVQSIRVASRLPKAAPVTPAKVQEPEHETTGELNGDDMPF